MVLLFLYHRLYHTAKRQLESLRRHDYATLEKLAIERDEVTRELCDTIAELTDENGAETILEPVRRKIHRFTTDTLRVDSQIKDLLLRDLKEKTLELDRFCPSKPD